MDECKPLPGAAGYASGPPPRFSNGHTRTTLWRLKLYLKAKLESGSSHLTFRRLVPGRFNLGLRGASCTSVPCVAAVSGNTRRLQGPGRCSSPLHPRYFNPCFLSKVASYVVVVVSNVCKALPLTHGARPPQTPLGRAWRVWRAAS